MSLNKFTGYWALLYLISNIFAQFLPLGFLASYSFNFMVVTGVILLLYNMKIWANKSQMENNSFIYAYTIIMIIYQFTFGFYHINEKTWTYFIAKIVCDFMFIVSVSAMSEFYLKKFNTIICLFVSALILYGIFFGGGADIVNGRMTYGFGNSNSLGAISAMCAGLVFISNKKLTKTQWIMFLVCAFGVLQSGSRTGFVVLAFAFLFKYGFNHRTIALGVAALIAFEILATNGITFVGVDRFIETVGNNDFSDTREAEREASLLMIRTNPLSGNGLYAQQSEQAMQISELGSHNGYIDLVKFMGIPLGGLTILFLIFNVINLTKRYYHSSDYTTKAHLFVVIGTLLAAFYEAYIWGVNQMITSMMFISLATLGYQKINDTK